MAAILVYSEKQDIAWELLSKATALAPALAAEVSIALLGPGAAPQASAAFAHGAQIAYVAEDAVLVDRPGDLLAVALQQIAEQAGAAESRWTLLFCGSGGFARKLAGPQRTIISSECETSFTSDPIGMPLLVKLVMPMRSSSPPLASSVPELFSVP